MQLRLKIRGQLITLLFCCALIPLLIVSIGSYFSAKNTLDEAAADELSLAAEVVLSRLEDLFQGAVIDLDTWSSLRVMQDTLIDDDGGEITDQLNRLRDVYRLFARIEVTNSDGLVVASTGAREPRDLAGSDLFVAVMTGRNYQGPVVFDPDGRPVSLSFAHPIRADYDKHTIIGALIGVVDWQEVEQRLAGLAVARARQDRKHLLHIVDREGRLLYQTAEIAGLNEGPNTGVTTPGVLAQWAGTSDEYLVVAINSRATLRFRDPGWRLRVGISTEKAYAGTSSLGRQFLVMGLLLALSAIALGWFGGSRFVRPITEMVEAMSRLARGKYDIDIRATARADEIGEMAAALQVLRRAVARQADYQKELVEAKHAAEQANYVKSEFLATMSHELRTPLNAVIGFSDIIKGEIFGPVGNARYHNYAKDINESGRHLLSLINDLLDLSKVEAGVDELFEQDIEVPNVLHTVRTLVKERARKGGVGLEFEIQDGLPALRADERKLKQILVNLLSNAIKFTDADGKVSLKTWCRTDSGYVFEITDNGIGIAPREIPKALSRFGQVDGVLNRRYKGTGLGLPLSKALVELHGGSLDLRSEVGVGTTVTVRFPAERTVAPPDDTQSLNEADRKAS